MAFDEKVLALLEGCVLAASIGGLWWSHTFHVTGILRYPVPSKISRTS